MPKMKTHKGSAKRFRRTASGKIMHAHAFKSHILTKKNQKRIRSFRQEEALVQGDAAVVSKQLGKGRKKSVH